MPMKLFDGSPVLCQVSRATATPRMLAKPSPAPGAPTAVGAVTDASANASVIPSAPVPWSMVASKLTVRLDDGTGVLKNAEPAAPPTLGVSTSDPLRVARLLICQVPAAGAGMAVPVAPTAIVAVAVLMA